jgi:hypothetical protein
VLPTFELEEDILRSARKERRAWERYYGSENLNKELDRSVRASEKMIVESSAEMAT